MSSARYTTSAGENLRDYRGYFSGAAEGRNSPPTARILTVTLNPTVDICLEVAELRAEGKNRARVRSIRPGGGGLNVARCIRRLGGNATAVYAAGGDTGLRLDHLLAAEGLDLIRVPVEGETREALVVTETGTGHSYHIVPPGPTVSEAEAAEVLAVVLAATADSAAVVVTGSVPPGVQDGFTAAAAAQARATGVPVLVDVTRDQLLRLGGADVFLIRLDRKEAAGLIGRPVASFADARRANRSLIETMATRHAVTTVGALGAVYSEPGTDYEISAPPLPGRPRSDACAGDSLVAALTYRIARGDSCLRACEFGVAAAAATVALPGTDVFAPRHGRRTGPAGTNPECRAIHGRDGLGTADRRRRTVAPAPRLFGAGAGHHYRHPVHSSATVISIFFAVSAGSASGTPTVRISWRTSTVSSTRSRWLPDIGPRPEGVAGRSPTRRPR